VFFLCVDEQPTLITDTKALLLRRERSDDFLEARIATERVPIRMELEKAVREVVRNTLHRGDLFDGEVFLTSPTVDLCKVNG
jgi:hypothetical protein